MQSSACHGDVSFCFTIYASGHVSHLLLICLTLGTSDLVRKIVIDLVRQLSFDVVLCPTYFSRFQVQSWTVIVSDKLKENQFLGAF